jgi:hypothetical protein
MLMSHSGTPKCSDYGPARGPCLDIRKSRARTPARRLTMATFNPARLRFWNRRTKMPPENFSIALMRLKIRLRAKKAAGIGALRLAGFEN